MPAIKPVSDLRSYNDVLADVAEGSPVFLTKNGRGCYAVLDMHDYDRLCAITKLIENLGAGQMSGETEGWIGLQDMRASFGLEEAQDIAL